MKNNKNKKENSSQSDITYVSLTIASLVIALFFMVSLLNSVNNNEDKWIYWVSLWKVFHWYKKNGWKNKRIYFRK